MQLSAIFAGLGIGLLATAAEAASGLPLELNKLEPQGNGCRVYLLAAPAEDLSSLKLDLVLFGKDGVITRRLAVEVGPLKAGKKSVKLFDLQETGCDTIGSILVNDVMACEGATGPVTGCVDALELGSRAPAELIK